VLFYLWTALATLLLTSGFWLVTAELFPLRGAKRLFGLVGAGGTAGAMLAGNGAGWLTERLGFGPLVPGLAALVLVFLAVQAMLPGEPGAPTPRQGGAGEDDPGRGGADRGGGAGSVGSGIREGLGLVWRDRHLRLVAGVVFAATVASVLVDYQFKELARAHVGGGAPLASFFGAFYGWTGAAALVIQLLVSARLITGAGLAAALAILPGVLLLGAAGLLVAPGLWVATLVRGADTSLRKSVHRSGVEVLFVPVPGAVRRKTKTFVDSVVDALAEGSGALLVFLWVTLAGLPPRWLSLGVAGLAAGLLLLTRQMDRRYLETIQRALRRGTGDDGARVARRDLLSVSFSRVDPGRLRDVPAEPPGAGERDPGDGPGGRDAAAPDAAGSLVARLRSPDPGEVAEALAAPVEWGEEHVPELVRLLARDRFRARAAERLAEIGEAAVPELARRLASESTDFVIRRRIPRALAPIACRAADRALLPGLTARRFEVRYRTGTALAYRLRRDLPTDPGDRRDAVWRAVRKEVGTDRPVWELQRLLDGRATGVDALVAERTGRRGELSLEHTFRLLSLVLEPEAVEACYRGLGSGDDRLESLAREYLEQVLPGDVRDQLWPFIGDLSPAEQERSVRALDDVVDELLTADATLFGTPEAGAALRRMVDEGPTRPEEGDDGED
jgi:hypothetical protein